SSMFMGDWVKSIRFQWGCGNLKLEQQENRQFYRCTGCNVTGVCPIGAAGFLLFGCFVFGAPVPSPDCCESCFSGLNGDTWSALIRLRSNLLSPSWRRSLTSSLLSH